MPSDTDVLDVLKELGAPDVCRVISYIADLDGRRMPLQDAIKGAEDGGWGTVIGCTAGKLAFHFGEGAEWNSLLRTNSQQADADRRAVARC